MPELIPYYGPRAGEQEARSFIAPFVDEFGVTHSPAVDSQQADFEAMVQARRLKGLMDFQRLVDGGATEQEALRLTGRDLFAFEPSKMVKAAGKTQQTFDPYFTDVEGGRLLRRGPNSAQFIPDRQPVMPPDVRARQELLRSEIGALRREQANPIYQMMGGSDTNRIADLERKYIANASAVGSPPTPVAPPTMQTVVTEGPEGISMRREASQPVASSEKVIVVKDGKRFRLPKSQLAEAEKEGYKLAK